MLRLLALLMVLGFAAPAIAAPSVGAVRVCDAGLRDCRATTLTAVDPQGREIWVLAEVTGRPEGASRFQLSAIAASEVWLNGVRIGANGRPGGRAAEEVPGRTDASFPVPPHLWRADGNRLAVRMSSFHAPIRLLQPVQEFHFADDGPSRGGRWRLALPLAAAGALLAGFLYFLPLSLLDRSRPRGLLVAMAGAVLVEAAAELCRPLAAYAYPWHPVRLVVILAAAWGFSVLLAAFTAERFLPRRWSWAPPALTAVGGLVLAVTPMGFDGRTIYTLAIGAGVSLVPALVGAWRRTRGAWVATGLLVATLAMQFGAPDLFLDMGLFLLAAVLTLAFLVAEVLRLRQVNAAREGELVRAASHPDYLSVATARGVEVVRLERLVAVVGADDYAELRLADGRSLLHAARLDQLEASLPAGFLRTHRSAIVNLAHVQRLARHGGGWRLELGGETTVPVARARVAAVRAAIGG